MKKLTSLVLAVILGIALTASNIEAAATDLTVTNTSVATTGTTILLTGICGATITAGQAVYYDSTSTTPIKVAIFTGGSATAATANVIGIAMGGCSSGQPVSYAVGGHITLGTTTPAIVVGAVYVGGNANGKIAQAGDLGGTNCTAGAVTRNVAVIGIGTTVAGDVFLTIPTPVSSGNGAFQIGTGQ